jgi:pantothenate kinase
MPPVGNKVVYNIKKCADYAKRKEPFAASTFADFSLMMPPPYANLQSWLLRLSSGKRAN